MSRTTEVARDKFKTLLCSVSHLVGVVASSIDGMINEAEATTIKDDRIPLTSILKATVSFESPPAVIQQPRIFAPQDLAMFQCYFPEEESFTKRLPERILPTILDWTMFISPRPTAVIPTYHQRNNVSKISR